MSARTVRRSRTSWRRRAEAAEAALAHIRATLGDAPERVILSGIEFDGCSSNDPSRCACNTWEPLQCASCSGELHDGDEVWTATTATPWFEDDEPGKWTTEYWHINCEEQNQ